MNEVFDRVLRRAWILSEKLAGYPKTGVEELLEMIHQTTSKADPAAMDDREFMEAVLYLVRTGCPWRDLPPEMGYWHAVYMRFRRWEQREVWKRLWQRLQSERFAGARGLLMDSTTVRACKLPGKLNISTQRAAHIRRAAGETGDAKRKGKYGSPEDMDLILPFLDYHDVIVRSAVMSQQKNLQKRIDSGEFDPSKVRRKPGAYLPDQDNPKSPSRKSNGSSTESEKDSPLSGWHLLAMAGLCAAILFGCWKLRFSK